MTFDGTRRPFRLRLAQRLWETEQGGAGPEARLGLARAQAKAGDRLEAAQEYLRILQIVPDQPEARRELARLGRAPVS